VNPLRWTIIIITTPLSARAVGTRWRDGRFVSLRTLLLQERNVPFFTFSFPFPLRMLLLRFSE
jgi:hypothetical protein